MRIKLLGFHCGRLCQVNRVPDEAFQLRRGDPV